MRLSVDSDCRWSVADADARPLIFEPDVAWDTFRKPHIIDDY